MIVLKIEDYFLNLTFKSNYIDIIDNISILLGTHRYIENINLSNPNEMELFIDKNPDGGYSLQFNNKEETCKDLCDLMGTLLCILYEKLPTEKFFYLHGGGVSKENICIALLAPSNGGKTTIVMGLLESGFNYRSDDIIPICKTDAKSFSFPKPIFFRDNSPYSQYSNLIIKHDEYKRLVWFPNNIDYSPKKLSAIFLLNRDVRFSDMPSVKKMHGVDKIKSVLYNIYEVANAQEAISYTANLLRYTSVYRLDYFTTNQAVSLINQIVENGR